VVTIRYSKNVRREELRDIIEELNKFKKG